MCASGCWRSLLWRQRWRLCEIDILPPLLLLWLPLWLLLLVVRSVRLVVLVSANDRLSADVLAAINLDTIDTTRQLALFPLGWRRVRLQ